MSYTRLTLAEVQQAFLDVARDAQSTFGALDATQLNWRPDADRWSVAQCFEHLCTANAFMFRSAARALSGGETSVIQRIPILPRVFGGLLIRSQSPTTTKRFRAPPTAQPTTSEISEDVLQRFVEQQCKAAEWLATLNERDAASRIMISPFIRFVTYSVLDGLRLAVAHDHRHVEQARRVMRLTEFPAS